MSYETLFVCDKDRKNKLIYKINITYQEGFVTEQTLVTFNPSKYVSLNFGLLLKLRSWCSVVCCLGTAKEGRWRSGGKNTIASWWSF